MTAVLAVLHAERIDILADGAVYDDQGRVLRITSKIFSDDRGRIVISGRGKNFDMIAGFAGGIIMNVQQMGFDAAMVELQKLADAHPGKQQTPTDLVMAGFSLDGQPQLKLFCLTEHSGLPPMKVIDVPGLFWGGPEIGQLHIDEIGNLSAFGAGIFERARNTPGRDMSDPESSPIFGVGGFVEHVELTSRGAVRKTLRRWPDKIGETIKPRRPRQISNI